MGKNKTEFLGAWLDPEIKIHVNRLASLKGVSLSEYLRNLILDDLDARSIFTSAFKEAVTDG